MCRFDPRLPPSSRLGIDPGFVQQIMIRLKQAGLVDSKWGYAGGYFLAKPAQEITQRQVIEAAEEVVFKSESGDPPLLAKARRLVEDRVAPVLEKSILEWPLPPKTAGKGRI